MKAFVLTVVLAFVFCNSYAGMDFSMLSGVPDFKDRYDAIFYGLINNEDKSIKKEIEDKVERLELKRLKFAYRDLSDETRGEREDRMEEIREILSQIYYCQQAFVVATNKDFAMLNKEERIEKYEKLHHMKFNKVGSSFYAGMELVR